MKSKKLSSLLLATAGLLCLPALAQNAAGTARNYQEELAMCAHLPQDRAACQREAGAARDAARKGQLASLPDYSANALARCASVPPADRTACEARVTGTGQTSVQGSVMGGGVIRETVTTTVMPAPAVQPAPMPASPATVTMPMPVMPAAPLTPR